MTESTVAGRDALGRHAWVEAYEALRGADSDGGLGPEDLQGLAEAAWFAGEPDQAIDAMERAYTGYAQSGRNVEAAAMALRLAERAVRAGKPSVAQGWLARAERLLRDEPESPVHAWDRFMRTAEALLVQHDPAKAIRHADEAIEIGQRQGDRDVQAIAMSFKGAALLRQGRIEEGLALLDESAAAATSGELDAKTACDVYCFTIATCRDLSDYRRAAEWTEQAERFMQRESMTGYPGVCRVHRAELKRLQGHWTEAEEEARAACDELERHRLLDVLGFAHNEIGEIRRRIGDLAAAEEAFARAYQYGIDPQPGLALTLLARGEAAEAGRSIDRSLSGLGAGDSSDPSQRARLLPAKVEIALALDDLDAARVATEELEALASGHEIPIWRASAVTARGLLDLAEGRLEAAADALGQAWRLWQGLELPYESARARTGLGQARQAAGDESGARLEFNAALSTFRQLRATPDIRSLEDLLASSAGPGDERRVTKTFMFTDVVASTELIGMIGDEAWAKLLGFHDRTLRSAFAARGGELVAHTGDGFFVAFDDPRSALECAVDIQRELQRHRGEQGFAPWVRIGLHTAEATAHGGNYSGGGVHVAARVSSEAGRDEILATAATVAGVEGWDHLLSEGRAVSLKGLTEPVLVHSIAWS